MGLFNERKTMAGQPFMRLSRCGAKSAKTRHASAALSLVGDDAQSWRRSEKVNALPKKSADLAEGAKNGLQRRQALRRSCYVTTRPRSGSVGAVGWAWRVRGVPAGYARSAFSAWLWAIAGVLRGIQCARRGPVRGGEHGDPWLCSGIDPDQLCRAIRLWITPLSWCVDFRLIAWQRPRPLPATRLSRASARKSRREFDCFGH